MKKLILISVLLVSLVLWAQMLSAAPAAPAASTKPAAAKPAAAKAAPSILDFEMKRIDGSLQKLSDYKGKVLLIVNTASKCGLTYQYEGLQKLYDAYAGQGFAVLGFPANNFLWQEPGTDGEIAAFCTGKFNVTFPMFSKVSVKGKKQTPMYNYLTELSPVRGPVKWNFQKYLVDREGRVLAAFHPKVEPDDPRLIEKLDILLAQTAEQAAKGTAFEAVRVGF